jgi:hypothetical protein
MNLFKLKRLVLIYSETHAGKSKQIELNLNFFNNLMFFRVQFDRTELIKMILKFHDIDPEQKNLNKNLKILKKYHIDKIF